MAIKEFNHAARKFCIDRRMYTFRKRGYTDRPTYACWHTPVEIIPGSDKEPCVCGLGYWKTGFRSVNFFKTLYTPSTFRIKVGENWRPEN